MIDTNGLLSVHAARLSGAQFEEFCVEWIEATKESPLLGGTLKNVQTFGRPGQGQDGIDIFCDVSMPSEGGGQGRMAKVVLQCKRVRDWDAEKTRKAIQKVSFHADECILVLAVMKDAEIQRVVDQKNRARRGKNPFWYVWFIDDIQQRIVSDLKNEAGAKLISTFFGSAVSHDLIGFDSASPLLLASARFAGQSGALAHERPILGRTNELQRMLDFLADESKQVLILSAEGGNGKTRLLREFAHRAAEEQPSRCVRWLDQCLPETLDEAFQRLRRSDQWVLILDDVHRWDRDPAQLFQKMARHGTRVKIVIGTRPYRRREIEQALVQSGYLTKQQERLADLRPLPRKILRDIATEALELRWQGAIAPLVDASGGNLLILQLGADYLNGSFEASINLHANPNFRSDVLAQLIDEKAIAQGAGQISERAVRELLDVLSILSSAPLAGEVTDLIAAFVGITPQNFRRLLDHLKQEGHLELSNEADGKIAQYRLVPDVLSDYRACEACYEETGTARDLPSRLWVALEQPHSLLPWMLRNLSEAEYLAKLVMPRAGKVTMPLMKALREEYSRAGWRRRAELLGTWKSVAEFQPVEALEHIREVLRLGDDQPEERPSEIELLFPDVSSPPSFQTTLSICADMLAIIGSRHSDLTTECLDLLWELAGDENSSHLDKVAEICSLNRFGPIPAAEAGITWIRARIMDVQTLHSHEKIGGLIHSMLAWTFQLKITENEWVDEKTLQFRETHRTLSSTRHLRKVALEIADSWLRSPVLPARLAAASFFRNFITPHDVGARSSDGGTAKDRQAWRQEESYALSKLTEVISITTDAATLWAIRDMLIDALGYALHQPAGRHTIHDILESFPDSFELRVHRLLLSSEHSDTWESEGWCAYMARCQTASTQVPYRPLFEIQAGRKTRQQAWDAFVKSITEEIIAGFDDVGRVWNFLIEWNAKITTAGQPNFWAFFTALRHAKSALLAGLSETIITGRSDVLDHLMPMLLSLSDPEQRSLRSLDCLRHKRSTLALAALQALRFSKAITNEEWIELRTLAAHPAPSICEAVLRWAEEAHVFQHDEIAKVFEVLAAIPLEPNQTVLVDAWVRCLRLWINEHFPLGGIPHGKALLSWLIPFPDLQKHQIHELLVSWSRHAPEQCLNLLEARITEENISADGGYRAIPFALELHSLDEIPGIDSKLIAAFDASRKANPEQNERWTATCATWFEMIAYGAWKTYLEWLEDSLASLSGKELALAITPISTGTSFAFRYPDLTEKLLVKANAERLEAKRNIRSRLIRSLHPGAHSYVPGTPRAHDVANREKALELSRQNSHRPLLYELYNSVVESSEKQIEGARDEEST
jgi:hypothetical protein